MEKQSDLLNKVKLMEAKQERDEPVRTFVARLRGLVNIRILYTQCTGGDCTQMVSHAEPTILLALVKGLYDGDTKGEVLSKVTQMNLDDTVTFVEARNIGKGDLQLRGGGPSSGQVNALLAQGKCWRFGQEGHNGRAAASIIRHPEKHSTEPVQSVARLAISTGSARSLVI